jgi:Calcineurin-like phosphoesterase
MSLLVIGDLHLTDRPKDGYRWGIFDWIREKQAKYKTEATVLMGDLTEYKDNHSSALVNRVVSELIRLEKPVYILMGNHDYIDHGNPFFGFVNNIKGLRFIFEPELIDGMAFVPHFRKEDAFEAACRKFKRPDYLFLHNTFDGSLSESGARLSGFRQSAIELMAPRWGTYAGDVHRPQKSGFVTYVGSPYTIRFGDDFEPRCLLLKEGKVTDLYFECPRKWALTIRSADELVAITELMAGDQVKLTLELAREEAPDWQKYKADVLKIAKELELEVFGVAVKVNSATPKADTGPRHKTPIQVVESFCNKEKVPSEVRKAGLRLLEC